MKVSCCGEKVSSIIQATLSMNGFGDLFHALFRQVVGQLVGHVSHSIVSLESISSFSSCQLIRRCRYHSGEFTTLRPSFLDEASSRARLPTAEAPIPARSCGSGCVLSLSALLLLLDRLQTHEVPWVRELWL